MNNSFENGNTDAPEEILHPGSRSLFRYWESVRGERPAPFRSEIDLKQIAPLLPSLALLERDPVQQVYTWRLVGSEIVSNWGKNITGHPAFGDWEQFERDSVCRVLDTVVCNLQPAVIRFKAINEDGDMAGMELLALPAIVDGKSHAHAFSVLLPFRKPDWLGKQPLVRFELSSLRVIWTEPVPGQITPEAAQSLNIQRQRRRFRVIEGGLS